MTELLLLCTIAGQPAALPALRVLSVVEVTEITPIPGTPPYVVGLMALRSQALTVIDCAVAIGVATAERPQNPRAAVVEVDGHRYALLLDGTQDVCEPQSEPTPVAGGFGANWRRVARGLVETGREPAVLLDIDKLLARPAIDPTQTPVAA